MLRWRRRTRREILRFISVTICLLFLCCCCCSADEIKELPEKGDDACLSLDERQELSNNGEGGIVYNPCDQPRFVDVPENGIVLPFYVAAPAYSWSFDTPLAFAITTYLNEDLSPMYYVHMPNVGRLFSFVMTPTIPDSHIVEVHLLDIHTTIIQQSRKAWWRRYLLVFECKWGTNTTTTNNQIPGSPITSDAILGRIRTDMTRSFQDFLDVIAIFELHRLSNGTLAIGADDPRERPFADQTYQNWTWQTAAPTPAPTMSLRETGTYTSPVRVGDWSWHRSLGLWMLLVTVALATLLTHLAGARQRRVNRSAQWGTAEGVEILLEKTRWKLQEAQQQADSVSTTAPTQASLLSEPARRHYHHHHDENLQQIVEEEFDEEVVI